MSHNSSNSSVSDNEYDDSIDWCGRIINNRYIILNKLGKGSYCTVWNVYDIDTKILYALKIYNEEDTDDALHEISVMNEIKKLNIPNVLLFKSSFEYIDKDSDDTYIMQLYDLCGYSLYYIIKLLRDDFTTDMNLYTNYVNFVYNIVSKLMLSLTKLNECGYAHTDIKPENILINIPTLESMLISEYMHKTHLKKIDIKKNTKSKINIIESLRNDTIDFIKKLNISNQDIKNYLNNFNFSIKIADFGTSMRHGDPTIYKKHTQYYKSPKIILKYGLDNTYDFWSLGCTIYELLTGKILFDVSDYDLEEQYGDIEDRNLMYLICCTLGLPDNNIINKSPVKDLYFTHDNKCIRGYTIYKKQLFINDVLDFKKYIKSEESLNKFFFLINKLTTYVRHNT